MSEKISKFSPYDWKSQWYFAIIMWIFQNMLLQHLGKTFLWSLYTLDTIALPLWYSTLYCVYACPDMSVYYCILQVLYFAVIEKYIKIKHRNICIARITTMTDDKSSDNNKRNLVSRARDGRKCIVHIYPKSASEIIKFVLQQMFMVISF